MYAAYQFVFMHVRFNFKVIANIEPEFDGNRWTLALTMFVDLMTLIHVNHYNDYNDDLVH